MLFLYPSLFYQKFFLIWPMFISQIGILFTPDSEGTKYNAKILCKIGANKGGKIKINICGVKLKSLSFK